MFAAGETEVSFDIPVYEDEIRGEVEAFRLAITSSSHEQPDKVRIVRPSATIINIIDTTGELTLNDKSIGFSIFIWLIRSSCLTTSSLQVHMQIKELLRMSLAKGY